MIKSPADVKSISAVAIDARALGRQRRAGRGPGVRQDCFLCALHKGGFGGRGGAAVLQSLTGPFEHDVSPSCGSAADPVQPRARVRLPRRPQRGRWAVAGAQARRADRRENEPETAGLVAVQVPHTVPARGPACASLSPGPQTGSSRTPQPESGEPRGCAFPPRRRRRAGRFRGGEGSPPAAPPLTGRRPQAPRAPAASVLLTSEGLSILFNLPNSHPTELGRKRP